VKSRLAPSHDARTARLLDFLMDKRVAHTF
jgi:hypothetical protein